jgi:hypothetical protein
VRYLDERFDPSLEVDLELTAAELGAEETLRLQGMLASAIVAAEIPRRLSDATREELALDKRRSRRVAHALRQSVISWGGFLELEPTAEQRSAGAQINWAEWWGQHEAWLIARQRYVATWAKKTNELSAGKTALVKLRNEYDWLKYAMRP